MPEGICQDMLGGAPMVRPEAISASETASNSEVTPECQKETPTMVWHDITNLAPVLNIFRDPTMYALLCAYCKGSANLECENATLSRVFCGSCRIKLGQSEKFRCPKLCDQCVVARFIDPMGRVAPLCSGCHKCKKQSRTCTRPYAKFESVPSKRSGQQ
jgi:hypothetical protein